MYDVVVIGAGVVGCAIARQLSRYKVRVAVLEAGADVAMGASRANSAIVHAGYDCKPGTNMARVNVAGNALFDEWCRDLHVPLKRIGSLVVAFSEEEMEKVRQLYDQGVQNGVPGMELLGRDATLEKQPGLSSLLDGLHFHTLCEQDADALAVTLDAVEEKFGDLLPGLKWLNFGGGHHITRPDYNIATLEACIARMQEKYGVQVYLEPGEAWALNAGYLVTTVLDTLQNGDTSLAILDMSAACHTPDVIEMPYRPPLLDAGEPGEKPCTIRLGGPTCLAGDVVGDYSFDAPPAEGDQLIFGDMAIYTTCKNNTFNGMPLPPIWALAEDGTCRELVRFGYNDFKMRLGHRA